MLSRKSRWRFLAGGKLRDTWPLTDWRQRQPSRTEIICLIIKSCRHWLRKIYRDVIWLRDSNQLRERGEPEQISVEMTSSHAGKHNQHTDPATDCHDQDFIWYSCSSHSPNLRHYFYDVISCLFYDRWKEAFLIYYVWNVLVVCKQVISLINEHGSNHDIISNCSVLITCTGTRLCCQLSPNWLLWWNQTGTEWVRKKLYFAVKYDT